MARIPQDTIQRLKSEVDLAGLVRAKGVELAAHGKDLIGLCPFHDDHDPSLVVTPAKNLWHCLGACQAGGSVIDWVMRSEGVSFRHAVELLQADPSLAASSTEVASKVSTVRRLPTPFERDAGDDQLLGQVVDFYHQTLKQSPEAQAYLEQRGLASAELIDQFKLGFANRTLGYRLPEKNRRAGAELRGRLQQLGILRETGHEHFRGCLVVPVFDEQGQVVDLYGRRLGGQGVQHLYLPGPHQGVFNVAALQACDEVILCEALIDALTFWAAGFRNVTTSYGVEGFGPQHLEAFKTHGVKRVRIAYDRDKAGDQAAEKLAELLSAEGIESLRVQFPKGMDANKYALQVQPAAKSLGVLLRSASWLGKGEAPAPEPEPPSLAAEEAPADAPASEPEEAPAAAGAAPVAGPAAAQAQVTDQEVVFKQGNRRWRVRGLAKNQSYDQLKVNVLVANEDAEDSPFHVDTFDLYSSKHRTLFLKQASAELGLEERVLKRDLGKLLLELEQLQEQQIEETLKPKPEAVELSPEDRAAALELLKAPDLLDRILRDFETCGVVGEQVNKLVGYLATVSRNLDQPLAVIVQSSSAAGKSSLMESILAFVPPEDRTKYSAMTGQSLFYMGESDLKHKILAIVEEEGAERASYALKLLQSEGELTIASTGKDPQTGRLETQEYRVEGPVMIFLTTTAIEVDEELLNRCIVLTVDEDREQTRKIHKLQRQRKTLEGLLANQDRDLIRQVHQNAQRLLRPLLVANPYAEKLTFLDDRTRTRRDHMKYLTLIQSITLLHQYQRPVQRVRHHGRAVEYIEVTASDIATANRLAHQVLGRSLDDLPPQTRRMLTLLDEMVAAEADRQGLAKPDYRFSRRQVREYTRWSTTQVKVHLDRLEEQEYLVASSSGRGRSVTYELLYDGQGQSGDPFLTGLLDVGQLQSHEYEQELSGSEAGLSAPEGELSGPKRAQNGPKSAPGRGAKNAQTLRVVAKLARCGDDDDEKALLGTENAGGSYVASDPLSSSLAAKSC